MTYACATSTRPNVVMAFDIQVIAGNCTFRRWPLMSVFGDLSSTCVVISTVQDALDT